MMSRTARSRLLFATGTVRVIASLLLCLVSSWSAPSHADVFEVVRKHSGRVATWGPVMRDGGEIAAFQEGTMSWAEYTPQGEVVRLFPADGSTAVSPDYLRALATRWLERKQDYEQTEQLAARRVDRAAYLDMQCRELEGGVSAVPGIPEGIHWVLVPANASANPDDATSLPYCENALIAATPLFDPELVLDDSVSSVLINGSTGEVVALAHGGNRFAIETALFHANERAPDRKCSPEYLLGIANGSWVTAQRLAFDRCYPGMQSMTDRLTVWGPIQGAIIDTWASGAHVQTISDPTGAYSLPLSFPFAEWAADTTKVGMAALEEGGISVADIFNPESLAELMYLGGATATMNAWIGAKYQVWAEVRYDSFNPRRLDAGWFTIGAWPSPVMGSLFQVSNFLVDTTTITILGRVMKGPSSYEDEPVPVVGTIHPDSEFTLYDVESSARGELRNQGLLEQVSVRDLTKTDTYIFREADGSLIGTRQQVPLEDIPAVGQWTQGLGSSPPGCSDNACLLYSAIMRGPSTVDTESLQGKVIGPFLWRYDRQTGAIDARFGHTAEVIAPGDNPRTSVRNNFLRIGDDVRVAVVNRATGYLGTFQARVMAGSNGVPIILRNDQGLADVGPIDDNGQGDYRPFADVITGALPSPTNEVSLRPPNLRIRVKRVADGKERLVGADGAALTSDARLEITTEWYDEDGSPLPHNLPGFTGRLSRVVDGTLVGGESDAAPSEDVGQFAIRPGRHVQFISFPQGAAARQHYYVHVSGAPTDELVTFSPGMLGDDKPKFTPDEVCHQVATSEGGSLSAEWQCRSKPDEYRQGLDERPASFVPFQVLRFDRELTRHLAEQAAERQRDAWASAEPLPVLDDFDVVYRWVYSPEMHFSLYELDVTNVDVRTEVDGEGQSTSASSDYDLRGPDSADLSGIGVVSPDAQGHGLTWGVGFDRIAATVGDEQRFDSAEQGEGSLDDMLATTAASDAYQGVAEDIQAEDFLSLGLYVDGDEPNSLWEINGLVLLMADVHPLSFVRRHRTSETEEGAPAPAEYDDSHELLRVLLTKQSTLELAIQLPGQDEAEATPVFSLVRDPGEHFIALDTSDVLARGVTKDAPTFNVLVRARSTADARHAHLLKYPARFEDAREDEGEGDVLGRDGKLHSVDGSDGMVGSPLGGGGGGDPEAPGSHAASSEFAGGGASLVDGSARLSRVDISLPSVGPPLEFARSYSNLANATSDSALGVGWSHNYDLEAVGIALEGETRQATPIWFQNLKQRRVFDESAFPEAIPERWGEIMVNGVRFTRGAGGFRSERGYQGTLVEQDGRLIYTDLAGDQYEYDIPKVPIPGGGEGALDTQAAMGRPRPEGSPHVRMGTSLIHRIRMDPAVLRVQGEHAEEEGPETSLKGRLHRIASPNGQALSLEYDAEHPNRLVRVRDDFARMLEFEYEPCVELPCVSDSTSRERLTKVSLKTAAGASLLAARFKYDRNGYLEYAYYLDRTEHYAYRPEVPDSTVLNLHTSTLSGTVAAAQTTEYTYFGPGDLAGIEVEGVPVAPHDVLKRIRYPESGEEDSEAQDGAPTMSYTYARLGGGRLERKVTDARGFETRYVLNEYGNVVEIHEPLGRITKLKWTVDESGPATGNFIEERTEEYGSAGTRRYEYTYGFDGDKRLVKKTVTGPLGTPESAAETFDYDPRFGVPTRHVDRNGNVEEWRYDNDGTLSAYTDGEKAVWTFTYYSGGLKGLRRTSELEGAEGRTTWTYDAYGYVASLSHLVMTPNGARTEQELITHDVLGQVRTNTDELNHTTVFDYDGYGNLTKVTFPALSSCPTGVPAELRVHCQGVKAATSTYDELGNKLTETDRAGLKLTYTYTAGGLARTVTRSADGATRRFFYDNHGNVVSESDWAGVFEHHRYDALDRLEATVGRHGKTQTFAYDLADNLVRDTDYAGTATYYEYDTLDRRTELCVGSPCNHFENGGRRVSYTYYKGQEPEVNLKTQTERRGFGLPDEKATYEYDGRYDVVKETDALDRVQTFHYRPNGSLARSVDEEEREVVYTHDSLGRLWKQVQTGSNGFDTRVHQVETPRDAAGNTTHVRGPERTSGGALVEHETRHDEWNRQIEVVQATSDEGGVRVFRHSMLFDERDGEIWKRDPSGAVTATERDLLGQVTKLVDAEGATWTFDYDANGNEIREVEPGSVSRTICRRYDAAEQLVGTYEGAAGNCEDGSPSLREDGRALIVVESDGEGHARRVRDPLLREWTFTYDANYAVTSTRLATLPSARTTFSNDGLLVEQRTRRGFVTRFAYDALGRNTRIEFPDDTFESYAYRDGEVVHHDRNGVPMRTRINDFDDIYEVYEGDQLSARLVHDAAGQLESSADAKERVTTYAYYDRGLLRRETYPDGTFVRSLYDLQGNLTELRNELDQPLVMEYDRVGRRVSESFFGEKTSFKFDDAGRLRFVTPPESQPGGRFAGQLSEYQYDLHGRLVKRDEAGVVTEFGYDPSDNLKEVRGPEQQRQEFRYDVYGRLEEHVRHVACPSDVPDCGAGSGTLVTRIEEYDENDNPVLIRDAKGQERRQHYDEVDRLIEMTFEAPAGLPNDLPWPVKQTFAYAGEDRLVREAVTKRWPTGSNTEDVTEYHFDGSARLDHLTQRQAFIEGAALRTRSLPIDVDYDAAENLTCIATGSTTACAGSGAERTGYEYDARDRMKAVVVEGERTEYSYLADGRLQRVEYPNGTQAEYTYHDQPGGSGSSNHLFRLAHRRGSSVFASFEYQYSKNGQRTSETSDVDGESTTTTYTYDALDRLREVLESRGGQQKRSVYEFGAGFNRTREQVFEAEAITRDARYSYDTADRLSRIVNAVGGQATRYHHDENGNLVAREIEGAPESRVDLYYDALDQLVRVHKALPTPRVLGTYDYDSSGMRIREWQGEGAGVGRFYVDGNVVEEFATLLATPSKRFRWAGDLLSTDVGSERGYYHQDQLGNTSAITDDSGEVSGTWRVDAHGRSTPGESNTQTLGAQRHVFTGHVDDRETGLVYMRARYYDPETGRFISQDLAEGTPDDPRSMHRYLYAHGDPINNEDPTGLETVFLGQHQEGVVGGLPMGPSGDELPMLERAEFDYDTYAEAWSAQAEELWLATEDERASIEQLEMAKAGSLAMYDAVQTGIALVSLVRMGPPGGARGATRAANSSRGAYKAASARSASGLARATSRLGRIGRRLAHAIQKVAPKALLARMGQAARSLGRSVGRQGAALRNVARVGSSKVASAVRRGGAAAQRVASRIGQTRVGSALKRASGAVAKAIRGCTSGCFAAGTMVLTPHGMMSIEDLHLGDRVLTRGAILAEAQSDLELSSSDESDFCPSEVDDTWRVAKLIMESPDGRGDVLQVETLKPRAWFEDTGAREGTAVWLDLPDMGLAGLAHVIEVRGPPALEEGPGCVVLSTYKRLSDHLLNVRLSGVEAPLEITAEHRVFSEDRGDFVAAGQMEEGELVRTAQGTATVESVEVKGGLFEVFNLEVEVDHRFYAGDGELLTHNASARCAAPNGLKSLLVNGKVPGNRNGAFAKWFNGLNTNQFNKLWANPKIRKTIESRIRHPGKLHEWLMAGRANKFKQMGVKMEKIHALRTPTKKLFLKLGNLRGKHGRTLSGQMHNELAELIDKSTSFRNYVTRMQDFARRWLPNGVSDLPPGLRKR